MAVGMAQMKLAHAPGFVGRWHCHRHAVFDRKLICVVNCGGRFEPPTHPDAASLIVADELRLRPATRSLATLTEKDLALAVSDCAKAYRRAFFVTPVPEFVP